MPPPTPPPTPLESLEGIRRAAVALGRAADFMGPMRATAPLGIALFAASIAAAPVAPAAHAQVEPASPSAGPEPGVHVRDQTGCVEPDRLRDELAALAPGAFGAGGRTRLSVEVTGALSVDGRRRVVTLDLSAATGTLWLSRTVRLAPGDCPVAPALLARIVARRLDELPPADWHVDPGVEGPAPTGPVVPTPDAPAQDPVGASVALGVEVGPDPLDLRGVLRAGLHVPLVPSAGPGSGPRLLVIVEGAVAAPIELRVGAARLAAVLGGVGLDWPVPVGERRSWEGRWELVPALWATAGATLAQGEGLTNPRTTWLARVELGADLGVRTPVGLTVGLGVAVAVVRTRARLTELPGALEGAPGASWLEGLARARLTVGYSGRF